MQHLPEGRDGCSKAVHIGNISSYSQDGRLKTAHTLPSKKMSQKSHRLLFILLGQNLVSQACLAARDAGKHKGRMDVRSVARGPPLSRGRTFVSAYVHNSTTCVLNSNEVSMCQRQWSHCRNNPLFLQDCPMTFSRMSSLSHDCKQLFFNRNLPCAYNHRSPQNTPHLFLLWNDLPSYPWLHKELELFCLLTTWN